jgi:hypothetical protein
MEALAQPLDSGHKMASFFWTFGFTFRMGSMEVFLPLFFLTGFVTMLLVTIVALLVVTFFLVGRHVLFPG